MVGRDTPANPEASVETCSPRLGLPKPHDLQPSDSRLHSAQPAVEASYCLPGSGEQAQGADSTANSKRRLRLDEPDGYRKPCQGIGDRRPSPNLREPGQ